MTQQMDNNSNYFTMPDKKIHVGNQIYIEVWVCKICGFNTFVFDALDIHKSYYHDDSDNHLFDDVISE